MQGDAECTNGYGGASPDAASSGSSGSDAEGSEGEEVLVEDAALPARALNALNALRKSRQHYDVLLVAEGEETPAHRAVLAAASPYFLDALADAGAAPLLRVEGVSAGALRALVEWAYTGRLRAAGGAGGAAARALYEGAWRLRMEAARAALAAQLVRRAAPSAGPRLRALPDLAPPLRQHLDHLIATNFDEICASGALASLPNVTVELLRESSAEDGAETPRAVADAAFAWLRARADLDLEELCSRTHLLYVDSGGELRDCGELPAARGDAPELCEYRREAAERRRRPAARAADAPGGRERADAGGVLAARCAGPRATQALLAVRGRVLAARVLWRPAGGPVARGGRLGHTLDSPPEPEGERRAELSAGRCAAGAAALRARLLVCGGYDRARVLRSAEAYEPERNRWAPLPDMRGARARMCAARLGDAVYVVGGSDGHAELDSVDAFTEERGGAWAARAPLPGARSHAAAAADEGRGALYVLGGWAGGRSLKAVLRYVHVTEERGGAWAARAPLPGARSHAAAAADEGRGALYVLGGWAGGRSLKAVLRYVHVTEERGGAWAARAPLPGARSHAAAAADEGRGALYVLGGWAGGRSLKAVLRYVHVTEERGGAWAARAPLPGARSHAAAAADEGRGALYVLGGWAGGRSLKAVLRYVHVTEERGGAWAARAPLPGARSHAAAAADEGRGALYVLGGWAGGRSLKAVLRYVHVTEERGGAWAARAPLPGARSHAAAAADEGRGALYVLGGWAGGRSLKAVLRYSPTEDRWTEAPPLSAARLQCAAVTWHGALWALGGCDAWRCLATTELLHLDDPAAGWSPGPMLPTARRSMGGCVWRGRLVLAGGSDGSASLRRVDWLPPPRADAPPAWQAGPPMRRARAGLGLAELGDALYAAGGFSGREFLACVEWLPAPDAEWTALTAPPAPPPTVTQANEEQKPEE